MSEQIDVSVIVPTYNTARYLEQCLESIAKQTHDALEIICLNDGSTDESLSIMQAFAQRDSRFVIVDKGNEGYGATCNRGLDRARGTYIAIVEPDDWIEPGMFGDMLAFAAGFEGSGSVDVIKTPYWRIWRPDTEEQRKLNCSYKNRVHPPKQPFTIGDAAHLLCHHPSIWSALYRKEFLVQHGIRFKEIPGAGWADNPFLIETLCQAERIVYLDKPYYCYREETDEKSASFARSNTFLPFERWNDMTDILDRLEVVDPAIRRAHNSRGFTYLNGVLQEIGFAPGVREAAEAMFARMDPELVMADPEIAPDSKRMFLELRGLPEQSVSSIPYTIGLVKQFAYSTRNNGLGFTRLVVGEYLRKRKARSEAR